MRKCDETYLHLYRKDRKLTTNKVDKIVKRLLSLSFILKGNTMCADIGEHKQLPFLIGEVFILKGNTMCAHIGDLFCTIFLATDFLLFTHNKFSTSHRSDY